MSRGKKGKSKSTSTSKSKNKAGSAKSTPHRALSKRHLSHPWPAHEASAPNFSLVDEARWMSSNRSAAFQAGNNLRHMPIQFISAGQLQGTLKEPKVKPAQATEPDSSDESATPSSPSSTPDNIEAMAHMAIRSPSPALSEISSSSADEVIFKGRGGQAKSTLAATPTAKPPHEVQKSVSPTKIRPLALGSRDNTSANVLEEVDSESSGITHDHLARRRGNKPAWEGTTTEWEHRSKPGVGWLPGPKRSNLDDYLRGDAAVPSRDAALDDYMRNMEDFGLTDDMMAAASGFARREMDLDAGSHNDWESASASGSHDSAIQGEGSHHWDSDMIQDFEDLSTSSDVMDIVVRILSKRIRKSGLQYLCVYAGSVTDDARWLPSTFLKSKDEKLLIRSFEADAREREEQLLSSSNESANEDEDEDEDEDADEDADSGDFYDEELDDETIARVLQKQEELGLGSDEVLLYAADDFFHGPSAAHNSFGGYAKPNRKRPARVRDNHALSFPSASAMADALSMDPYYGFDIMDTERPSLKPKKKGRRAQQPLELDDSDLNEQLQQSWAADRVKKRLKKAEREELRHQGLLGRKGKAPSMKVKYQGGIVMEDIVEEIREFLMGDMQTLSLPPMEAHRRAAVHQAAATFNLSSRSRGDGMDRFTVLSKTSRTRFYTDADFDREIKKKGFQKRLRGPLHTQGDYRQPRFNTVKHGVRARAQVGYKDGETVGANAPELGPENKGHALMMKMGWSKGAALGFGDNKGILTPIPHVIKTNKAGLQ